MDNKNISGYELSRNWFDFCFENPDKIKPNHTALYFFAIEHCNRLGWKEKFGLPTTMVMEAIGIKSYNTYANTLRDLVDWKFITMVEKSKNQYSANIIALSNFNKAHNKALDKALIKHTSKQSESTIQSTSESIDSIDKQVTTNNQPTKQDNKEPVVYSTEVHACYKVCLSYFPEHLRPKDKRTENNWLDTIDKLNRIDKIPFPSIEGIVKSTRGSDFWSKNFLSLTKLRKKNKDGIAYIVVFNESIKTETNDNQINGEYTAEQQASNRRIFEAVLKGRK